MKSWKTTIFGAVSALGVYFSNYPDPYWLHILGQVLTAVGTFGIGATAKDANVTGGTVKQ